MIQDNYNTLITFKVLPDTGCWIWQGFINSTGYGIIKRNKQLIRAHRYIYELLKGPIAEGLELDHLCRVTACVNPAHLEPVTHKENLRRGKPSGFQRGLGGAYQAAKTHCPYGHPYTKDNIYYERRKDGSIKCRRCRTCVLARVTLRHYRLKAATKGQGINDNK